MEFHASKNAKEQYKTVQAVTFSEQNHVIVKVHSTYIIKSSWKYV